MPATEHAFTDLPPARLYLDTNVVFDYLIPTRPQHARVDTFVVRLFTQGVTTLYVSPLSWMEFVYVIGKPSFHAGLPSHWQAQYNLAQWTSAAVRRQFLADMLARFETFLNQFPWAEVVITPMARVQALQYVTDFGLKPQDALHLACAREAGVLDLASFDRELRAVDGLDLWNDRIHALPGGTV